MQDSQMQTESPYTQFRLHRQPQALDNRFLLSLKSILSKPRFWKVLPTFKSGAQKALLKVLVY